MNKQNGITYTARRCFFKVLLVLIVAGVSGAAAADNDSLKLSESGNAQYELQNYQDAVTAFEGALKKDLAAYGRLQEFGQGMACLGKLQ